jgi:hypothetical protein
MEEPQASPEARLVYMGIDNNEKQLYIPLHTEESALFSHHSRIYNLDLLLHRVSAKADRSPFIKIEDLGWFTCTGVDAFSAICRSVPIRQDLATEEKVLDAWRLSLLETLEADNRWPRNVGNYL